MTSETSEDRAEIAVIGLGNAGLPLAAVIADSGIKVVGVDVNRQRCLLINQGKNPIPEEKGLDGLIEKHGGRMLVATADYRDAAACRTFIVIVPVFVDENYSPDFTIMQKALQSMGGILKKGDLVVLETTFPPGTTEGPVRDLLCQASGLSRDDFLLAYSPERIMTGYSISRLKEFPKVIGGTDEQSGIKAFSVYKRFISNLHQVSSARAAEMIKVMEGCYRDVNIGLANELFRICGELGIDFFEARENACHQYCHIHLPSTGVGGHCIPVYPWFLIKEMERREKFESCRLLRTARVVNDGMIDYWMGRILEQCLKINKPLASVKICILGITFRAGVKEFYHSRNLALAKRLAEKGLDVYAFDELLSSEEVQRWGLRCIDPRQADLIFDCFNLRWLRAEDWPVGERAAGPSAKDEPASADCKGCL